MRRFKLGGAMAAAMLSIGLLGGWGITAALGGTSGGAPNLSGPVVKPLKSTKNSGKVNWAVVEANGSLVRAYPTGITTETLGGNVYIVTDTKDIEDCTSIGSVGEPGSESEVLGELSTQGRVDDPNSLFVETFNGKGEAAAEPFHIAIIC